MDENRRLPGVLKAVSVLFIIGGILSAIEVIVSLLHGHININFGVLGIFIGFGLLALKPGWRTCALVFLWITMVGIPIITLLMFCQSGSLDFKVFGQFVGKVPREFGLIIAAIIFLLSLWQYRILTRPDVRQLFGV